MLFANYQLAPQHLRSLVDSFGGLYVLVFGGQAGQAEDNSDVEELAKQLH